MSELRDAGPSFLYEPQVPDLRALLRDLLNGSMVIPRFQRRFVGCDELVGMRPQQKSQAIAFIGLGLIDWELHFECVVHGRDFRVMASASAMSEPARSIMQQNADVLKAIFAADPGFRVALEGHCDERGSAEYNLGLGDRRSTSAKDYLVQLGVPVDRISTISYGKDRPQCQDANEDCYQKNRRAHLVPAR